MSNEPIPEIEVPTPKTATGEVADRPALDWDEFVEECYEGNIGKMPLEISSLQFAATVVTVSRNAENNYRSNLEDLLNLENYGILYSEKLTKARIENDDTFEGAEVGDKMWTQTFLGNMTQELAERALQLEHDKYLRNIKPTPSPEAPAEAPQ